MVSPVATPQPTQPSPIEIQSWQQGQSNARRQYLNTLAQSQYGQTQATNAYDLQRNQLAYNQRLGRQQFDDPYIGRGIFNSGIRGQGLSNFYTNATNERANAEQQYLSAFNQYGLDARLAGESYVDTIRNIGDQQFARQSQLAAEELVRRAGLANQIREII